MWLQTLSCQCDLSITVLYGIWENDTWEYNKNNQSIGGQSIKILDISENWSINQYYGNRYAKINWYQFYWFINHFYRFYGIIITVVYLNTTTMSLNTGMSHRVNWALPPSIFFLLSLVVKKKTTTTTNAWSQVTPKHDHLPLLPRWHLPWNSL